MVRRLALVSVVVTGCVGSITGPRPTSTGGDPARPPEPARLDCGGQHPAATAMQRLTPTQYRNVIRDLFSGAVEASASYPGAYGRSVTGFSTEAGINAVGEQSVEQLMLAAEDVAVSLAGSLRTLLPCTTTGNRACASTFLDTYGRRAFRRPLTDEERNLLLATFDAARADGASFTDAVAVMSAQLFQSPQFLYLAEGESGGGRALDGYELASRLSFLFWGSAPDDELLNLAAAGALAERDTLLAQTRRLLASPHADTSLARFFREWLELDHLTAGDKSAATYPDFTDALARSMNESFDRTVVASVRGGETLAALMTSPSTFVDASLAPLFGLTAPAGQWLKVTVAPERLPGLVGHPLPLASHAHASSSSYVLRGRMIRLRLLCQDMPPAPGNALAQFATIPLPENPTGKEVSARVRSVASCAGCHQQLDPAGLAFEHFDGAAHYRETYESGRPIDVSGLLALSDGEHAFSTPAELTSALGQSAQLRQCLARQLFRFTFSRRETDDDGCALQALQDTIEATGGSLEAALVAVVTTDAFTVRRD